MSGHGFQAGRESGRERTSSAVGVKPKFFAELADDRLQDFAIGLVCALFGALLEVSVEFEDGGVVDVFSVSGEDAMEGRKDSGLPVDQRAVTVEGKDFEAGEVEHGSGDSVSAEA